MKFGIREEEPEHHAQAGQADRADGRTNRELGHSALPQDVADYAWSGVEDGRELGFGLVPGALADGGTLMMAELMAIPRALPVSVRVIADCAPTGRACCMGHSTLLIVVRRLIGDRAVMAPPHPG